jgi:lipopolysaccharide heptosyltransferase I
MMYNDESHALRQPRVLITRLSAIGDAILTLPLLCALRRAWPGAYLAWICEPGPAQLLNGHPALDRLIVVPKRWLRSWQGFSSVCQLRRLGFDIALDPQGLLKSAMVAWLSGARRRIGFSPPRSRECSHWLYTHRVRASSLHVVDAQLELLRPLGLEDPRVEFRLPEFTAESAEMNVWLQQAFGQQPFAAIHPGASWPSRRWPPERFAEVCRYLGRVHCLPVLVVWGTEQERVLAQRIASASETARVAPATTLRQLACLLRRAAFVVAADSGPLHLAAAAGVAVVGIYGATSSLTSGPYGSEHCVVQSPLSVPHKQRRQCTDAMLAIDVESVCAACDQVWASQQTRRLATLGRLLH